MCLIGQENVCSPLQIPDANSKTPLGMFQNLDVDIAFIVLVHFYGVFLSYV